MRKSKQAKAGTWLAVGGISLVLILAFVVYSVTIGVPQTAVGDGDVPTPAGTLTSAGCNIAPSVVNAITDTSTPGTSVTATNSYRMNGVYTGATAPTSVGTADILFNSSGYLNKIKAGNAIGCGANLIVDNMLAYTNATLTIYSDNGLTALADGTVNESVKVAGGSYNWKLHLQGVDKKSTGKQLVIIETSVPANVSSITMNAGTNVAVPNGYTRQLTNGFAVAYLLPALTGNVAQDVNIAATAATAKILQGRVEITVISVEPFVETDGTFSDSGLAYNSLNAAKFHDSQTTDFIIV